jgi:hypothetical protein
MENIDDLLLISAYRAKTTACKSPEKERFFREKLAKKYEAFEPLLLKHKVSDHEIDLSLSNLNLWFEKFRKVLVGKNNSIAKSTEGSKSKRKSTRNLSNVKRQGN